ncbi:MAG: hypothetical protein H6842_15260 [Rhodospirillaceae bacterium]|nr:hypothetical protein [Rhodospirillaceae bacterium]
MDADSIDHSLMTRGNVTVDPLAPATPAENPAIKEVLDLDSGEFIDTESYIAGRRYEEAVQARNEIREKLSEHPRFACAICNTHVYLVCNQLKHFFFRHKSEDGSCPAETRSNLSREEICARKYHGLRESEPHRKIKRLIERSLAADPAFYDVKAERHWRSSHDPSARRQPDVQATCAQGRIAFEAQLSTTFLDVVTGRRAFYRKEGALLIWIMRDFDPDYRRLTTDDLLFSNNSNILVVDDETTRLSEAGGRFYLRCHYRVPQRDGDRLIDRWDTKVVSFDELVCEPEAQRVWYFDYSGEVAAIRTEIERDFRARQAAATEALRQRFIAFWQARRPHEIPDEDEQAEWQTLTDKLAQRGIRLPPTPEWDSSFAALLNGVISARAGEPVGWQFRKLVEVAHRIAEAYPRHIAAFGFAVKAFEREKLVDEQDSSGKWKRKRKAIRAALKRRDPAYVPDLEHLSLVSFLFPEIAVKLRKLAAGATPE